MKEDRQRHTRGHSNGYREMNDATSSPLSLSNCGTNSTRKFTKMYIYKGCVLLAGAARDYYAKGT